MDANTHKSRQIRRAEGPGQ
jgi:PAS domain S-box-containing protein